MMEKCIVCGKNFYPTELDQETCSDSCEILKNNMIKKPKEKTCIVCGNKFIPNNKKHMICSAECRAKRQSEYDKRYRKKKKLEPEKIKKKDTKKVINADKDIENSLNYKLNGKECIICGKKFIPKNKNQIMCSKECVTVRKKEQARRYRGKNDYTSTETRKYRKEVIDRCNKKWAGTKASKITDYEHFTRIRNIDIGNTEELEYITGWDIRDTSKVNTKYEPITSIALFRRLSNVKLHDDLYYRWNMRGKLDKLKQVKDSTLIDKELNYYNKNGLIEIFEKIEELGA